MGGTDGALVVDLRGIRAMDVRQDGTATVGAGHKLGDIALLLDEKGRGLPHGTCRAFNVQRAQIGRAHV
mgnify:CR=1 FL=1